MPLIDFKDYKGRGSTGATTVILPEDSQLLQLFPDWEALWKDRNEGIAAGQPRLHFLFGYHHCVGFSLDLIDNVEELRLFDENHQWSHDKFFQWHN